MRTEATEEDQPHYRDAGPWKGETGKLKGCSRSQSSKRLREDCGTRRDGVWEISRSRDSEKASGRALITDKDKTSTRYLQPSRKEGGFSTWCWRWTQKGNCLPVHFRISPAQPQVLSGKTDRS